PRGPIFAIGFTLVAGATGVAMLAALFEGAEETGGRAFAALLSGALVCMTLATIAHLMERLAPYRPPFPEPAVAAASRWLLVAAGIAAYPAFSPHASVGARPAGRAAGFGLSAASAFVLIFGAV